MVFLSALENHETNIHEQLKILLSSYISILFAISACKIAIFKYPETEKSLWCDIIIIIIIITIIVVIIIIIMVHVLLMAVDIMRIVLL